MKYNNSVRAQQQLANSSIKHVYRQGQHVAATDVVADDAVHVAAILVSDNEKRKKEKSRNREKERERERERELEKRERKKGEILFEPGQSLRAEKNLTLYISRIAFSAVEIMSR